MCMYVNLTDIEGMQNADGDSTMTTVMYVICILTALTAVTVIVVSFWFYRKHVAG